MSGRKLLGAVLAWLVVVASVSALVWVVISRAGQDLVSSREPVTTTRESTQGAPAEGTSPSRRTPSPRASRTPSRTPSATPSSTPSITPSSTPSPEASRSSSPSTPTATPSTATPTGSPSTPNGSATPTSSPSPTRVAERRTWQGRAGSVEVACGTSGIRLVSAQPATGFRAEVHAEDDRIEVEFEGREEEDGTKVKVVARCQGGVPTFSAESEND